MREAHKPGKIEITCDRCPSKVHVIDKGEVAAYWTFLKGIIAGDGRFYGPRWIEIDLCQNCTADVETFIKQVRTTVPDG